MNASFDEVSNRFRKLRTDELNHLQESESYPRFPLRFLLHDIRSMHNVGSVFRTADAFRFEQIMLSGITACPPHREIEKTALGATLTVPWAFVSDPIQTILQLKNQGLTICALEQCAGSTPLYKWDSRHLPAVFILGNEISGVNQNLLDLCDIVFEIPQHGSKHSLNVSVCAGIAAWVSSAGNSKPL